MFLFSHAGNTPKPEFERIRFLALFKISEVVELPAGPEPDDAAEPLIVMEYEGGLMFKELLNFAGYKYKYDEATNNIIPAKLPQGQRAYSPIPPNSIYFSQSPNYGISDMELSKSLLSDNKEIKIVEESYTSVQCGVCAEFNKFGRIFSDDDSERRKYSCKHCYSEFCRDINAARNIIIKNEELIQPIKGNRYHC